MSLITLKWLGKVLICAGAAVLILVINLIWRPTAHKSQKAAPATIRPYLQICTTSSNEQNIIEIHKCDHGWAVYRRDKTPQVFDEEGKILCEVKEISDASASDCLRQFSDQVGRCVVECTSVK